MDKWLVGVNSFFALEQFQRHLIVIVVILVFIVIFPHIPADLFVHEVELFDLLTARAQQVGGDVVKSLVVLDVCHISALNLSLWLHLFVETTLIFLYRLFDSKSWRSQRLKYWLTVSVQWYYQPVRVFYLIIYVAFYKLPHRTVRFFSQKCLADSLYFLLR